MLEPATPVGFDEEDEDDPPNHPPEGGDGFVLDEPVPTLGLEVEDPPKLDPPPDELEEPLEGLEEELEPPKLEAPPPDDGFDEDPPDDGFEEEEEELEDFDPPKLLLPLLLPPEGFELDDPFAAKTAGAAISTAVSRKAKNFEGRLTVESFQGRIGNVLVQ